VKREWKPGDVAAIPFTSGDERGMWVDGTFVVTGGRASSRAYGGVRPLVVIDPEDREVVGRLTRAAFDVSAVDSHDIDQMQAALRSLLTPPKPAEPTGLGAVVEDDRGFQWIRTDDDRNAEPWSRRNTPGLPQYRAWRDLAAVRVLSDGYDPERVAS
jgi:hypothetical protein